MTIRTQKKREVVDITDKVNEEIEKLEFKDGICNLFVTHTTAALTTADLDPGTEQDYLDAFEKIIPKLDYKHPHDPSHMPDHIRSSLIGTSLNIPVENGGESGEWIIRRVTDHFAASGNKKINWGYDVITQTDKGLIEAGIIDPVKVTRSALQNAASVAIMVMTTEVLISDKPEPPVPTPPMPPGGMGEY